MLKSPLLSSLSSRVATDEPRGEEEDNPSILPPALKYFLYLILAVIVAVAIVFATRSYQQAPTADVYSNPEGLTVAEHAMLKKAIGEKASGSYFTADLQSLRNIALGLSWVDEVNIERAWPKSITVTALPKEAVAKFGTERLVDAKGQVFVPADPVLAEDNSLVTLQGNKTQAPVIMQQMQQINDWYAPLDLKVVDIILTPRMTWLVRFDNGLRVIVDNENTAQKLMSLSQLLTNQLKGKREDIQSVDLRYKNGFTIAWKPGSNSAIEATQKHHNASTHSLSSEVEQEPEALPLD